MTKMPEPGHGCLQSLPRAGQAPYPQGMHTLTALPHSHQIAVRPERYNEAAETMEGTAGTGAAVCLSEQPQEIPSNQRDRGLSHFRIPQPGEAGTTLENRRGHTLRKTLAVTALVMVPSTTAYANTPIIPIGELQRGTLVTVAGTVERVTDEDEFILADTSGRVRVYVGPNWVPANLGE